MGGRFKRGLAAGTHLHGLTRLTVPVETKVFGSSRRVFPPARVTATGHDPALEGLGGAPEQPNSPSAPPRVRKPGLAGFAF